MSEIETFISLNGQDVRVGTLYREASRDRELVSFEYHPDWLRSESAFSLEPALQVGEGRFYPRQGKEIFGSLGDSAPDTWGRRLMQRAERRRAERVCERPRTLHEADYLLGVSDVARLGALRFKRPEHDEFQAPNAHGVPGFIQLGRLLESADRIERGEETDDDLNMIFAPGSSLGGARPKASVSDNDGNLAIAKFPKESDDYSLETWEHIGLTLASAAGITVARHEHIRVNDRPALLSWRFDRNGVNRTPFLSAMALLEMKDGDRSSYPEIVDELARHGSQPRSDARELFRRMVFSVLISNVDDHLRNHGFLWTGRTGWKLSPAYDINPTPTDKKARILSTNISLDDATCSTGLALDQAGLFGLSTQAAKDIIREVSHAVSSWRDIATCVGETPAAIERMSSAFEHEDLESALAL